VDIKKALQLARFLQYMLGHRPDEFGLVVDRQGYIPVSDVLKVLHGEGWSKVRRGDLETLNYHIGTPAIEIHAHLLRAVDRARLEGLRKTAAPPKLVYGPIRRRAYDTVLEHGLRPHGHIDQVILFADRELAHKVGLRRDVEPVIVTVNVEQACRSGCNFQQFGESIFLTAQLPAGCCRLPRPPKANRLHDTDPSPPAPAPPTPGSFMLNPASFADKPLAGTTRTSKQGSAKTWKKERRQARRWKERQGKPR
jgi:putative RNA 2'-phosphotransferase